MTPWKVLYTPDAQNDLLSFDKGQRMQILKAVDKVSKNPLPNTEGGYGKPLGKKNTTNLTGCLKTALYNFLAK